MIERIGLFSRSAHALLLGAALAAAPLLAKDVYKGFLDPNLPHHRAILDTLERLKETPNDAALHNDLGCLVAWDGFWRDALRELDTAATLDKHDSRPLFNAGLVQAWRGHWGSASRSFAAARSREPGNWAAWWMLGLAQEKLGNVEAAVDAYKTSLRVDTSLFDVARNPFAADTNLRGRVLLETFEKRLVRAGLPAREEFAGPERIATFFQKAAPPPPRPAVATPEAAPVVPTGPVVSSAPGQSTAPPRPDSSRESGQTPPRMWEPDPNAEQAKPVDNLPPNEVTPAPKKRLLSPGAFAPGPPEPTPTPEE
jgi:hypothetical protein